MITALPSLTREQALHFLMFTPRGRALSQHLDSYASKSLTPTQKREPVMDRAAELRSIAKDFGVAKLAGMLVTDDNAHGISEQELTGLIDIEAQKLRKAGERPDQAFARYYNAPENVELRKAVQIAKGF